MHRLSTTQQLLSYGGYSNGSSFVVPEEAVIHVTTNKGNSSGYDRLKNVTWDYGCNTGSSTAGCSFIIELYHQVHYYIDFTGGRVTYEAGVTSPSTTYRYDTYDQAWVNTGRYDTPRVIATATKTGYTFKGVYDAQSGGHQILTLMEIQQDI